IDPGLMPRTGLARTAPPPLRFAWMHVLPRVAPLLPDTSTPERSGAAAAWMLSAPEAAAHHGAVLSYDRAPSRRLWKGALDPELGRRALDETLEFLGLPTDPA